MTSICDIPSDIFINHITTYINLYDVGKLTSVSKSIYCHKEELLINLINYNVFLKTNIYISPYEITNIIKKSHFTYQSFLLILEGMCNKKRDITHQSLLRILEGSYSKDENTIVHELTNVDTSIESINSTFKIFQILKTCAIIINSECNMRYGVLITELMLVYFDEVFKKRFNMKTFNPSIIRFCFHQAKCNWHTIDINPYYIYENMNYVLHSKRSFQYRQNIENRLNILLEDSYENQEETIKFLLNVMQYGDMSRKIYVFYEIVKYMNAIYDHIYLSNRIINLCIDKINQFRPEILKCTKNTPIFMKKIIFEEFDKFIEINHNVKK